MALRVFIAGLIALLTTMLCAWGAGWWELFRLVFKPGIVAAAAVLESLTWLSGIQVLPGNRGMMLAIMLGVVFTFVGIWALWATVLIAILNVARSSSGSDQRPD